jgi:hypothetical protein
MSHNVTVQDQTAQDDTQQAQQPAPIEKKSSIIKRLFAFISRGPWTLLYPVVFALVALGGWWLINNPQIINDYVVKQPYALYAVLAVFACWLALWLTIKFFATISRWLVATWQTTMKARKEDPIAWFFWVTIYGLLAVSVLGSGAFFEKHFPHPVPFVGYAIALMFDLVTINAMRARLEALRTGDKSISWLYLLAIFVCTSATIFGNVYSALDFVNRVPQEMTDAAPWLAVIFPSMIIVMSVLADHLLEKTSTRLDAATYRAREEQRLNILIARREMREKMKLEEEKLAKLDAKPKKERRTFFLVRWLFPRDGVDSQSVVEQAVETIKPQLETLTKQNEELTQRLLSFVQGAQNAHAQLASLVEKQSRQIADIDAQRDVDNGLMIEQIRQYQETMQAQITDAIATLSQAVKTSQSEPEKASYTPVYKPTDTQVINVKAGQDKATVNSEDKAVYNEGMSTDALPVISQSKAQDTEEPITDSINLAALASGELPSDLPQDIAEVAKNYPRVYFEWIAKEVKSVDIDAIVEVTGQPKRRVQYHAGKTFTRTPKNPKLYTVTSVIKWLRTAPSVSGSTDEMSAVIPASNGNHNGHAQQVLSSDYVEMTV